MNYRVREGNRDVWTFTLKKDDTPYDLSGVTSVTMLRRSAGGTVDTFVSAGGVLAITAGTGGQVTVTPTETFWLESAGSYYRYFEVLDGGKKYDSPNGQDTNHPDNIRFNVFPKFS